MDGKTLTEAVTGDAATFAATMFYRGTAHMEADVLEHDGSVVLASEGKMNGKHDVWRAMYECHTNDGALVLMVTPHSPSARGNMLLIEDELDRCPFPQDVWGIERSTKYEIEFSNGSRIKTVHMQDENGQARLRGYHPDLLVVDNWEEEGYEVDDETKEQILLPMMVSDTDLWVNDVQVDSSDTMTQAAFGQGAYVKQMDR
jgi:hypothetical protein